MSALPSPELLALQQALAGRYSLIRELGRGGMGVVYLAQEVRLDRPVALKVLPPSFADEPGLRERFLREARTAARLSHPHIVPIHAVDEVGGFVFFAMAFIEGETLGERIRARGPLPAREAARILREVGWALAYAHAQGLVHRDVKPDNILLEAATGRALVTDFGIAHTAALAPDTGEVLGTAEFMSPEQAVGASVDERSDLYALGVVGFYMLSGRLPFQGSSTQATLALQLSRPPEPLAAVVPGVPLALSQAVDRCLAKDPAQRFANGEELAAAVEQAVEARREVPFALRLALKQCRDSTTAMVSMEVFTIVSLMVWVTLFAVGAMDFEWGPILSPTVVLLILAATPVAMLRQMARRLLRSGYDHADLVRALTEDLEERRGELAAARTPSDSRLDRRLRWLFAGGLGVDLAALGWMCLGPAFPGLGVILAAVLPLSLATWLGAGIASAVRHHLGGSVSGQGWLRLWKSRCGRWLFKGMGGAAALPAGTPYGPTELAIGHAANRLFEALPTQQRDAFAGLPEIVQRLELDAERMRAHIRDLDTVVDVPQPGAGSGDPGNAAHTQLADARVAAEDRLRQVVGALETIRVALLRLHAGATLPEGVTVDLGAAREVSEDVARLLEARREVDRLLGRRPPTGLTPLPTPA